MLPVFKAFSELNGQRQGTGFGPNALQLCDIAALFKIKGIRGEEAEEMLLFVREMDQIWCERQHQKSKEKK